MTEHLRGPQPQFAPRVSAHAFARRRAAAPPPFYPYVLRRRFIVTCYLSRMHFRLSSERNGITPIALAIYASSGPALAPLTPHPLTPHHSLCAGARPRHCRTRAGCAPPRMLARLRLPLCSDVRAAGRAAAWPFRHSDDPGACRNTRDETAFRPFRTLVQCPAPFLTERHGRARCRWRMRLRARPHRTPSCRQAHPLYSRTHTSA